MNTAPTGIPRYRPTAAPVLFRQGFRPFFLGAAVWAVTSLVLWVLVLAGQINLPSGFDPVAWHTHEMLYGFAVAAMAGFLLTAIPNWTGRFPLQGAPLVVLFLAWCAGRAAMIASDVVGAVPAALIDLSFLSLFLCACAREILAGRNWRNLPALIALFLLLIGNGLTHLEASGAISTNGLGTRLGIGVFATLITIVGGRLIPSFTRNRLAKRGAPQTPAASGALDGVTLALVPFALALWVLGAVGWLPGLLLVAAGVASAARLTRWQGLAIRRDALIAVLHLGYAWLSLGLALLGLSQIAPAIPAPAALHALGAGAIGPMIQAVMVRAILAHTGRAQVAGTATATLYALLQSAVLLRVAAAFLPDAHRILLEASGTSWIGSFTMFALVYGRYLIQEGRGRAEST
jgi:uncharacterized protein involved in response to NO